MQKKPGLSTVKKPRFSYEGQFNCKVDDTKLLLEFFIQLKLGMKGLGLRICTLDISNLIYLTSQLTFTCPKSRIETLEKNVKYVQS